MSYYGDDDYDYERRHRPSPHRHRSDRRSNHFLFPDTQGGLYRTRSQGHSPVPMVNIYNDQVQDGRFRNSSSSRSPPGRPPYPPSPEFRGRRDRLRDELIDGFADLVKENQMLRSRSRGRSDVGVPDRRESYLEWELRQKEKELRDIQKRESMEQQFEIQRAKEKAEEEAKRAEKRRIIDDYERQQREDEEDRKEDERKLREKIEREEREAKEREEREWQEFLQKQKEKEEKEKREKKEAEEKLEEEMRKRLSKNGYTHDQIERMIKDENDKPANKTKTTTTITKTLGPTRPTYAKIHRDYLSVDTLRYYDIPYEFDRNDRNYIIVLRDMDKYETEVLFEHTKKLRGGGLLLEPPKPKPNYAWYRKRDRSSSRVKKLGILEVKY